MSLHPSPSPSSARPSPLPQAEPSQSAGAELQQRIPAALWARLVELKAVLIEQGIVQLRATADHYGYRLRYRMFDAERGYTVHRSLALGIDERVAYDVQQLLEEWRAPVKAARAAATAEAELRRERRRTIRAAQALAGGGKCRRDRISAEIRKALTGPPVKALAYLLGDAAAHKGKPGRPPKCRLW